MEKQSLLQEILNRWESETPVFFKGMKKIAISLGSAATSVLLVNDTLTLNINEDILTICKYIIAVCATMGFTAQLTRVNPDTDNK